MVLKTLLFSTCYGRRDFEINSQSKIRENYLYLPFYSKFEMFGALVFLVSTVSVSLRISIIMLQLKVLLYLDLGCSLLVRLN